jgi:two-component system response regulator
MSMLTAPLVLLVDDDSNDEELARIALERSNIPHHLFVARDGVAALDWLFRQGEYASREEEAPPRLVLLDLKLPKINGLEVLEQIRADERTKTLPVVVFTSSMEASDLKASYRLGANGYIRKPVDFREYKELIVDMGAFWIRRNQVVADGEQPT